MADVQQPAAALPQDHPHTPLSRLTHMLREDTALLIAELRILIAHYANNGRAGALDPQAGERGRAQQQQGKKNTALLPGSKHAPHAPAKRRSSSIKRMSSVFGDWQVTNVRRVLSTHGQPPPDASGGAAAEGDQLACDIGSAANNGSTGAAGGGLQTVPEMDPPPSKAELDELYAMTVLDTHRVKVPFGTLVRGDNKGQRIVVVFIRHFFCGNCFGYVRALTNEMPVEKLDEFDPSVKLIVIGCGDPILVPNYIKMTGCPFEIYADPSRQLYDKIGFSVNTLKIDPDHLPKYVSKYSPRTLTQNILISLGLAARSRSTNAGKVSQNGGELIWSEKGELQYTHRMKHPGDHIEIEELERLLKAK